MNHGYTFALLLVDDFTEDHVTRVQLLVQHLGKTRRWPLGRPWFFDEVDESSVTRPGDVPIRTVGGAVPLRRPGPELEPKDDASDLATARKVIERLSDFGSALGLSSELQLGGQYVGRIDNGVPDRLVAEGLLGEWERSVSRPT